LGADEEHWDCHTAMRGQEVEEYLVSASGDSKLQGDREEVK
jgi:hypothetical protein